MKEKKEAKVDEEKDVEEAMKSRRRWRRKKRQRCSRKRKQTWRKKEA